MNRLSYDSTSPRRPGGRRFPSPQRRADDPFFTADLEPTWAMWRQTLRLPTF